MKALRTRSCLEMVLCTRTCEREGDVHTISSGWQSTPHASRTAGVASGEAEGTLVDGELSAQPLGAVSGRLCEDGNKSK